MRFLGNSKQFSHLPQRRNRKVNSYTFCTCLCFGNYLPRYLLISTFHPVQYKVMLFIYSCSQNLSFQMCFNFDDPIFRLTVTNVLSESSPSWKGHKGRIDAHLLIEVFGKDTLKCTSQCVHFSCLCGPIEFTRTGLELLRKQGMKEGCVHAFMG